MLDDFHYARAQSLEHALALLEEHQPRARVIAGGTNLLVNLRGGRDRPEFVVDVSRLGDELGRIQRRDGSLEIGSLATLTDVARSEVLLADSAARLLALSAREFANPLVRNRATIGGNIIDGSPAADAVPPLLALDARLRLVSRARGGRVVRLADFYLGYRRSVLEPDELLVAIEVPAAEPRTGCGWYKLGLRQSDAISIVSAACVLTVDGDERCANVRIGLGAVAPTVVRATAAERVLTGARLDEPSIQAAGNATSEEVRPISDVRATAAYRRLMSGVLVNRTVRQALRQATGEQANGR
ncbi:MAG: xanthine dehydrogenase family protein subunit M [Chloroflexi bacterium]|nr:xanthine dehydrogenase family protein subunit M [Chloroflexota bacterium]